MYLLFFLAVSAAATPNGYYHQEYNYRTSSSSYKNHELQHHNEDQGYYAKDGDLEGRFRPLVNAHSQHSEYVNPKLQHAYRIGTDRTSSFGQLHAQDRFRLGEPGGMAGFGYMPPPPNYGIHSDLRQVTSSLQEEMEREVQRAVFEHYQRAAAYGGITQAQIENDRRILEEELKRNMTMRLQDALKMHYGNQGIRGAYSYSIINGRLQPSANYHNQELTDLTRQLEEHLLRHLNQQVQTYYRVDTQVHTQRNTYRRVNEIDDNYPAAIQQRPVYQPYHPPPPPPPPQPHPVAPIPDSITTVATRVQTELNEILNKILEDTQRRYFSENTFHPGVDYDRVLAQLQDELRANITFHFDDQIKRTYGYTNYASKYSVEDIENLRRQIETNLITKLNRDFNKQRERFFQIQHAYQHPVPGNQYYQNRDVVEMEHRNRDLVEMQRQIQEQLSRQLQIALMQQGQFYGHNPQAQYQTTLEQLSAELNRNLTRQMEILNNQHFQSGAYEGQLAQMRNQLQLELMRQLQQGLQQRYSQYWSSWSSGSSSSSSTNYRPVRGFNMGLYPPPNGGSLAGEDCMMGDDPTRYLNLKREKRSLTQQNEDTMDLTQQTQDLTQQTPDLTQQTQDLTQQTPDLIQQTPYLAQQPQTVSRIGPPVYQVAPPRIIYHYPQRQDLIQQSQDLTQQSEGFIGPSDAAIVSPVQRLEAVQPDSFSQQIQTQQPLVPPTQRAISTQPNTYQQAPTYQQIPQAATIQRAVPIRYHVYTQPQPQPQTPVFETPYQRQQIYTQSSPNVYRNYVSYNSPYQWSPQRSNYPTTGVRHRVRYFEDLHRQSSPYNRPVSYGSQLPTYQQKPNLPTQQQEFTPLRLPKKPNQLQEPEFEPLQLSSSLSKPGEVEDLTKEAQQQAQVFTDQQNVELGQQPIQDLSQQSQDLIAPTQTQNLIDPIQHQDLTQQNQDLIEPVPNVLTQQSQDLTEPIPHQDPTQQSEDLTEPILQQDLTQQSQDLFEPIQQENQDLIAPPQNQDLTQQSQNLFEPIQQQNQDLIVPPQNQDLTQQSQDLTQQMQDLTQQSEDLTEPIYQNPTQQDLLAPFQHQDLVRQNQDMSEPIQYQDLTQQNQDLIEPVPHQVLTQPNQDLTESVPQQSQNLLGPIQHQDFTQQSQNLLGPSQDKTQQTEDLTQQSQDLLEPSQDLTQQIEDLTQQSQNLLQSPQQNENLDQIQQDLIQKTEDIDQPIEPQISSNKVFSDEPQLSQQTQDFIQQEINQNQQNIGTEATTPTNKQQKQIEAEIESQHLIDLLKNKSRSSDTINAYSPRPVYSDADGFPVQVGTTRDQQIEPKEPNGRSVASQEPQQINYAHMETGEPEYVDVITDASTLQPQVADEVQQVDSNSESDEEDITTKKPGFWKRFKTSIKNKIG